jgi:hypothetical protein
MKTEQNKTEIRNFFKCENDLKNLLNSNLKSFEKIAQTKNTLIEYLSFYSGFCCNLNNIKKLMDINFKNDIDKEHRKLNRKLKIFFDKCDFLEIKKIVDFRKPTKQTYIKNVKIVNNGFSFEKMKTDLKPKQKPYIKNDFSNKNLENFYLNIWDNTKQHKPTILKNCCEVLKERQINNNRVLTIIKLI